MRMRMRMTMLISEVKFKMRWLLCLVVTVLRLAGSEDLYWRHNTDWSNPSNWNLGRAPCEGDVADLSAVPRGSVIKLDGNTTVHGVFLPLGSTIVLGRSISLRLSDSTTCEIQTPSGPMVAEVKEDNTFVGAGPKYWECSENWETSEATTAKTSPCGKDRAIFREDHYYSSVESNMSSVTVRGLLLRGETLTTELISKEAIDFKLNLKINPRCDDDPSLCPCFPDCSGLTATSKPRTAGSGTGGTSGRTAGIVVAVVVLVLILVAVGVLLVVLWLRHQRKTRATPYTKDELLGEPEDSLHSSTAGSAGGDGVLFNNPMYEMTEAGAGGGKRGSRSKKKGYGSSTDSTEATRTHEMETIAILRPTTGNYEPVESIPDSKSGEKKTPILDEYERL